MKVLAINGSPRKTWNTADMLEAALEVAAAQGAETEYIHLYDYNCKGCRSCFACKRIGSPSLGKCAVQDDLTPILEKILAADVVLFGQPIYFGHISSGMWALLERLWFAGMNYDSTYSTNYPKNVVCGMIFTMNSPDDTFYDALITHLCGNMSRLVGPTEHFSVTNTLQFDNYDHYISSAFDAKAKTEWHENDYPKQKAQLQTWVTELTRTAADRN